MNSKKSEHPMGARCVYKRIDAKCYAFWINVVGSKASSSTDSMV